MTKLKKSQVREIRSRALEGVAAVEEFKARPFKFVAWITNLCLGFLAFYVALLLQMKSSGHEIDVWFSIIFFVDVLIPIVIGIIVRIKREVILTYTSYTGAFKSFHSLMKSLEMVIAEDKDSPSEFDDIDMKVEKLEKWNKGIPVKAIWWQLVYMALSFITLVLGLARYLFF